MTQLVVLSGKGGTGKTSVSAALAHLASDQLQGPGLIMVDADVDAANLELLLGAKRLARADFQGGELARIDPDLCSGCGRCQEVCRFLAVVPEGDLFKIDPIACEGCAACLYECPENAIVMEADQAGEWYLSQTGYGNLYHAHLYPARENSGKLVARIKAEAKKEYQASRSAWMIVDGPPGIGCPVISALSGADAALLVTEPSLAGIHDLERALNTAAYFQTPAFLVINKADLYPEGTALIKDLCQERDIPLLGWIPYDLDIPRAMTAGLPVTAFRPDGEAARAIRTIWQEFIRLVPGLSPVS